MSDVVFITGLKAETIIGVRPRERLIRQTVIINLAMKCDVGLAARTDDLNAAVDYSKVSERIVRLVKEASYELIESLAENIASLVLEEPLVEEATVTVLKPGAVAAADEVGVTVVRTRNQE